MKQCRSGQGLGPSLHRASFPTQRIDLDFIFGRINDDPGIFMKYINTKKQLADILTKGMFTSIQFHELVASSMLGPRLQPFSSNVSQAHAPRDMVVLKPSKHIKPKGEIPITKAKAAKRESMSGPAPKSPTVYKAFRATAVAAEQEAPWTEVVYKKALQVRDLSRMQKCI